MLLRNIDSSGICGSCLDIFARVESSNFHWNFDHHKSIECVEVCAASKPSCYICIAITEGLQRIGASDGQWLIAKLGIIRGHDDTLSLDFVFKNTSQQPVASFILVGQSESVLTLPVLPSNYGFPSSGRTDSSEVFALAKKWINDCCDNRGDTHADCQQEPNFCPSRLIEFDPDNCNRVRLVSRKASEYFPGQPSFCGKYVTLSHCWGKKEFLKLSKKDLVLFQAGLDIEQLPPTFRDAMHVMRQIGQRWIWIDALCIIQDSKEDWLAESAMMRQVYMHSYCNISATAACDSEQGMFYDRPIDRAWAQTVWLRAPEGKQIDECQPYTLFDLSFWNKSVEEAPINQRSWVLQERLLAPRVLHFCRNQIAFECRTLDRAECREGFPHLLVEMAKLVEGARFKQTMPSAGRELRETRLAREYTSCNQKRMQGLVTELDSHTVYYEIWQRIVEFYTKLHLTKHEDRLIALSGIARMMQSLMKKAADKTNEYVAGLWRHDLERQLLWRVNDRTGPNPQPLDDLRPKDDNCQTVFRAPSFSWASVETLRGITLGPIKQIDSELLIKVKEIYPLPEDNEDSFGILSDGFIMLECNPRQIWLTDEFDDALLSRSGDTSPKDQRGFNRYSWKLMLQGEEAPEPYDTRYSVVYLDSPASKPSVFGSTADVFVVPALLTDRELICILVQTVHSVGAVRHQRVGLTVVDRMFGDVQNILQHPGHDEDEQKESCPWCIRGEVFGRSTICIV